MGELYVMNEEHHIVEQVCLAQTDSDAADRLVRQYLPFIKAETAKFIKRAPREGYDDELGIAMLAFYESVMAYKRGRGAFLKLAAVGIRNRLIDYYRQEQRHGGNLSLEQPAAGEEEGRTVLDTLDTGEDTVEEHASRDAARSEIEEFAAQLKKFDLSLGDIADNCPKQERTLSACLRALEYAKANPLLLRQVEHCGKLPIAQLSKGAGVEKKTLERHRKYMVAIMIAYTNGFEIIRGHLCRIKDKGGRTA